MTRRACVLAGIVLGLAAGAVGPVSAQQDIRSRTEDVTGTVRGLDVKETPTEIRIEMAADVLFDFDKAEIRPDAEPALARAAEILRRRARWPATVEGHTDAKGSAEYNQRLSERRAEAVTRWLQERGRVKNRLEAKGWGAARPVVPNTKPDGSDDPEGRQRNRRVEIVVAKGTRR